MMCLAMSCASIGISAACTSDEDISSGITSSETQSSSSKENSSEVSDSSSVEASLEDDESSLGGDSAEADSSSEDSSSALDSTSSDDSSSEESSSSSSPETPSTVEYTVTFDSVGGSEVSSQKVAKGSKVQKPTDPIREGYTFVEWRLEGLAYDFEQPVMGNIKLIAIWSKDPLKTFTVSFDVGEGTPVADKLITEGGSVIEPVSTLEGKYIDFWTLNGEPFDFASPILSDVTLVAVWKAGSLSLSFDSGADVMSLNDTAKLSAITDIEAPVTFESSDEDILQVSQDGTITVLAAGYAEITATVKSLRVTQGICVLGNTISTTDLYMVKWGYMDTTNFAVAAENNIMTIDTRFDRWDNKTGIVWEFTQPKEYYQILADKGYNVSFNISIEGESKADWQQLWIYGQSIEAYGLTATSGIVEIPLSRIVERYDRACILGQTGSVATSGDFGMFLFACGYSDEVNRDFTLSISGFELRETGYATKTVSYDTQGGLGVSDGKVLAGTCLTNLPTPVKDGYVFDGWLLNGVAYELGSVVEEDITLTASWKESMFKISCAENGNGIIAVAGGTLQLTVNTQETVTWNSADESVATIDENGLVTAIAGGMVKITATIGNEMVSKTIYVASADLKGTDFNKVSWGWNNTPLSTNLVENGYSLAVKFSAGAAGDGYWLTLSQPKSYYEKLAAEGYVLTFDLSVSGHEGDAYYGEFNWPLIKVFGRTLEEYGFTSGNGKIVVSMEALLAAYDMQAQFLAGEVSNVAQSNYWFTIDRVNDYDRYFNLIITNYQYVIPPKDAIKFVDANDGFVGKGENLQLDIESEYSVDEIVWNTSDSTIATVENGVVTGVSSGIVTISASINGFSISKKVYVVDANLQGTDFNKVSWGWNNAGLTTTAVENGYSIAVKFNTGAAGDGYWLTLSQPKSYYEKLAAEGYVLTFDLSVAGHEGDAYYGEFNWPLIKVFGKTLEEYGFTSGTGTITVSMDAILAAYDMQAQFLAGQVSDVAQTNYWFTIDRVDDYARFFNLTITNYEFVKSEV